MIHNLAIAYDAIKANKIRASLTALGIIFGVAAVIAMLAIGEGAKQEILEQMKLVGVNNVVITPVLNDDKKDEEEKTGKSERKKFSPGLTLQDALAIRQVLPAAIKVSPEVVYKTSITRDAKTRPVRLVGVTPDYFRMQNMELSEGKTFNEMQMLYGKPVCIIGSEVKTKFFSAENPVGSKLKCGKVWLEVTGVLKKMNVSKFSEEQFGISNANTQVYTPLKTAFIRFQNRALVSPDEIAAISGADFIASVETRKGNKEDNHNQLDKIVVQVSDTKFLTSSSEVIHRILKRRHSDMDDFEIKIPELLLRQQQKTKDIFNIVLGAIAGISLLVGGIGIMNIMLASIMERVKEIGIRLSVGATKKDIMAQFLTESALLSVSGGIIGIALGIALSIIIHKLADILTVISAFSIAISFIVSAGIGIIFGFMPAKRAAEQDPVTCLHYE